MTAFGRLRRGTEQCDERPLWAVRVRQIDGNLADAALHPWLASSPLQPMLHSARMAAMRKSQWIY